MSINRGLFQRYKAVAAKLPNKLAFIEDARRLTYGELAQRIDLLSTSLSAAGIQPGERVAVILPNSPEFLIAAFGIWKRGAILVPLHASFQEQEILKYVMDCRVRGIIAAEQMIPIVESIQGKNIGVKSAWLCRSDGEPWQYLGNPTSGTAEGSAEYIAVDADAPAISQYSTGSTGFSKRITRTHRHLIEECETVAAHLGVTAEDRILGAAPFFHSYGLCNAVIAPLLSGATLYAVNDFFPRDVIRLIESEKLTGFPGVPMMYQLLADQKRNADFSSLRYALSAGSPLSEATASAFEELFHVRIRQLYGSTETGVMTIEPPTAPGAARELSVGFSIPRVTVKIVDENFQAVPSGVEGQIAVASPFAATRYDNVDAKTESHFQDGTFFPGDLGRLCADGRLVLCGRNRGFINVAGNKVDPAEVESVLREFPTVVEAVVVGIPDGSAGEKIKAVLVTSSTSSRIAILEHCSKRLAEFKRPRLIEFRTEIPKNALGKILRKYLITGEMTAQD
jgi:long-chain acyl-CoA synthetase